MVRIQYPKVLFVMGWLQPRKHMIQGVIVLFPVRVKDGMGWTEERVLLLSQFYKNGSFFENQTTDGGLENTSLGYNMSDR